MNTQIIDFELIPVEFMPELERAAYASGDIEKAKMIDLIQSLITQVETLQEKIDELESEAKGIYNHDEYKSFFETCFEFLNGHYPCPSVTSDYDCSVIFDAIQKGEQKCELKIQS